MKYDDDRLLDNAACASQLHALMDEETTRQAVKDNVCAPLRAEIAAEKQRADGLAARVQAMASSMEHHVATATEKLRTELAEAKADAERLANENAELWEAFQRVEDRSAGIDPHSLSDDAILSREDIAELVEEAKSKRGEAAGRSMREIAEFEMVCTRSEYVAMATNLARLSNDRDAATKCSNGLVADLAACELSREKALAELAAVTAQRDELLQGVRAIGYLSGHVGHCGDHDVMTAQIDCRAAKKWNEAYQTAERQGGE